MRFKLDKQYLKYYAYAVLGVISVILFYKVLDNLGLIITTTGQVIQDIFGILLPIILGGVLAYFLFRPMRWFERKIFKYIKGTQAHPKKVRFTAIVIVYLIVLFFMVVFLYIRIPSIVESVINLAGHIPQYTWEINRFLDQLSQSGTALKDLAGIIRVELANFTNLTLKGFFDSFVGDPGSVSGSMAQMGNMAVLFAKGTTSF
ncbi:AI-2E family transporter, partial [Eubacterium aggregans]